MPQMTFTDTETALHARVARRERLVQAIETGVPQKRSSRSPAHWAPNAC